MLSKVLHTHLRRGWEGDLLRGQECVETRDAATLYSRSTLSHYVNQGHTGSQLMSESCFFSIHVTFR